LMSMCRGKRGGDDNRAALNKRSPRQQQKGIPIKKKEGGLNIAAGTVYKKKGRGNAGLCDRKKGDLGGLRKKDSFLKKKGEKEALASSSTVLQHKGIQEKGQSFLRRRREEKRKKVIIPHLFFTGRRRKIFLSLPSTQTRCLRKECSHGFWRKGEGKGSIFQSILLGGAITSTRGKKERSHLSLAQRRWWESEGEKEDFFFLGEREKGSSIEGDGPRGKGKSYVLDKKEKATPIFFTRRGVARGKNG